MRRPPILLAAAGAVLTLATLAVSLAVEPADAATNACGNPVLATDLSGWGALDGGWTSRDPVGDLAGASWAFDTGGRRFYMPEVSVSAGQSWTFSAMDRVVFGSGTAAVVVEWYNAAGQYLTEYDGAPTTLPAANPNGGDPWYKVSATATVPSGATTAHVLQVGDFGTATGTNFKATECDYELGAAPTGDQAAVRYGWGSPVASQSDEYNGTAVDLTKWGLFGANVGQTTGCSPGFNGNGQRCGSQTTESGGYLSVTGTADGKTGGLYGLTRPFRYGRVEVRERALPLAGNGGDDYHAVPLLWPDDGSQWQSAEIDFAERDVAAPSTDLFVHHDGTQSNCSLRIDSTQFHNYAIDWQPNTVTWYVDGARVCSVNATITAYSRTNGGAQMDMFPPTGTLMRPAREDVDWIRMYASSSTQYQ
jgi:hypothetical protein